MRLTMHDWLAVARAEYLRDFVGQGGAAVKFAVADDPAALGELRDALHLAARDQDFVTVAVDAARTKLHMVDHLFHEVARQVDWDALAYTYTSRLLAAQGLRVPAARADFTLAAVAALNDVQAMFLRNDVSRWLQKALFRDYRMSREFRLAMIQLCLAQLDPDGAGVFLTNAVTEWLRGELRLVSGVKSALIVQKVARHNARHMLFSLAHWIRLNGRGGLLLTLDIARYAVTKRAKDAGDGLHYSTPAAMDAYEVLRQCIDGTDEMEGCLIVVLATPEFLEDERRGLARYDALRLRIADEVRDRHRQNPLGALVRLSGRLDGAAVAP